MWKVVTSFNLNPLLKLFFYSSILINNNLLLKIYCKNIVVIFFNLDFFYFLYYFSSNHFIFIHISFHFFSFFFFLFFSSTQVSSPLLFIFSFTSSRTFQHLFASHQRERETCRPLAVAPASPLPLGQIGLFFIFFFFSFFFFSYFLVLIQLYFKNWILFCVWINFFAHEQVSLFFLFSDFIWFMRKKEATATE